MGIIEDALQAAELIDGQIGRATEAREKLQEAARSLRETLADIRAATRDAKAAADRVEALTVTTVGTLIEESVRSQIAALGSATKDQMRESVAKVTAEFDKLEKAFLGQERGDERISIPEMIGQMEAALQLKWPVFLKAVKAAQAVSLGCSEEDCDREPEYAVRAMLEIEPGMRGETHVHLCAQHRDELKKETAVTILKTARLENQMCPWEHGDRKLFHLEDE